MGQYHDLKTLISYTSDITDLINGVKYNYNKAEKKISCDLYLINGSVLIGKYINTETQSDCYFDSIAKYYSLIEYIRNSNESNVPTKKSIIGKNILTSYIENNLEKYIESINEYKQIVNSEYNLVLTTRMYSFDDEFNKIIRIIDF
jgi:hypothetical protein